MSQAPRDSGRGIVAARFDLACIATNNVHYATPAQRRLASAVAAVRARRSLDQIDPWLPASSAAFLRSGAEQRRRFARYPGVIEQAAAGFPKAHTRVRRILLARPLAPIAGTERLAAALCRHASRIMGARVEAKGVPLYTDARHYAAAGVPIVLYGAGPRTIEEANAHRADERLPLADLHRATAVVALALTELLCSTGGSRAGA